MIRLSTLRKMAGKTEGHLYDDFMQRMGALGVKRGEDRAYLWHSAHVAGWYAALEALALPHERADALMNHGGTLTLTKTPVGMLGQVVTPRARKRKARCK